MSVLFPELLSYFCFSRKNCRTASEPCPPVVKPNRKCIRTIAMEIEELRVGLRMVKECSAPGHPVIIVIKGLWNKWYGKAPFLKWVFPLLSA